MEIKVSKELLESKVSKEVQALMDSKDSKELLENKVSKEVQE